MNKYMIELYNTLSEMEIHTVHYLKKNCNFLIDKLRETGALLLTDGLNFNIEINNATIKFYNGINASELKYIIKQPFVISNLKTFEKSISGTPMKYDYQLPLSRYFNIEPEDINLLKYKGRPETVHIAKLLFMVTYKAKTSFLTRIIENAYNNQLKTFLETGTIPLNYPDTYNPKKDPQPNAILSVSEDNDRLVWKHGKYCPYCYKKHSGCFCDIDINDECFIGEPCGECGKEMIRRYLMKDFNDTFTEENCKSLFLEWTDWIDEGLEDFDDLEPLDWTQEKFDEYYNIVSNIWMEYADGDVEGMCSCPSW